MYIRAVSVPDGYGLHSRSASNFINKAKKYESFIWVGRKRHYVDAKNLFEVLSLNVSGGIFIEIFANGVDEERAVEDLVEFVKGLN